MKKRKANLSRKLVTPEENFRRVNNILSADKLPMTPDCRQVALEDIGKVLNEYFDTEGLTMDIREDGRSFRVTIEFSAIRVKTFNLLK